MTIPTAVTYSNSIFSHSVCLSNVWVTVVITRGAWAATGIVVVWFVCLFVCDRLAKAKKLVSESAYLDVITVRLQHR